MSKHTKGPWAWVGRPGQSNLMAGRVKVMGHEPHEGLHFSTGFPGRDEADARRIVACVNICEGIDTESIEKHVNLFDAEADAVSKIAAQRDQLLAALKDLLATHEALLIDDYEGAIGFNESMANLQEHRDLIAEAEKA